MTDPLRTWIMSEGANVHDGIVATSIPSMGGGKGVVAKKKIPAGAKIVSMPNRLMLTTRAARHYLSQLSPRPTNLEVLTPVEVIMSFLIIAEQDPRNQFYGWLRSLPRRYDNLLELPFAEECYQGLNDTSHDESRAQQYRWYCSKYCFSPRLADKCVEERHRFEASVSACCRCLAPQLRYASSTHQIIEGDGEDSFQLKPLPLSKFLWAYNSLMSRGFSYDDDIWAMMPWVDYFNYSLHPNVSMRYNQASQQYLFVATQPISAGEQLFLQYGKYSDFELALWYGFTLRPVLFPDFKPTRTTHGSPVKSTVALPHSTKSDDIETESETSDDEDKEVIELNTLLAYVFSPTYDPNGDLPIGLHWAAELALQADLKFPSSWGGSAGGSTTHDPNLQDVRLGWGVISNGLKYFVRVLLSENDDQGLSSELILQRLLQAELKLLEDAHEKSERFDPLHRLDLGGGVNSFSMDAAKMALNMSMDHLVLLKKFAMMSLADLRKILDQ